MSARGQCHWQDHAQTHPGQRRTEESAAKASAQAPGTPPANAPTGDADPDGGSHHPWLGDQVPPFTLLIAVDDATGTVAHALFCEKEEAYTYFLLIQDLVQSVGIPIALYVDRHGVFRHTPGSGLPGTATQFSRAMGELGIQMIFALSPQAKGRVEQAAGTFQDGWLPNSGWRAPAASGRPTACWSSFCHDTTGASGFPRNALSPCTGLWALIYLWSRSCASSTAGGWPGTIR